MKWEVKHAQLTSIPQPRLQSKGLGEQTNGF